MKIVYEFLTCPDKCYMPRKGIRQNIYSESYTNILVVKKGVSTLRSALLWLLVPLDTQIYFFLSCYVPKTLAVRVEDNGTKKR